MKKKSGIREKNEVVKLLELVAVAFTMLFVIFSFQTRGNNFSAIKLTRAKMDMDEIKKVIKKYAIKSGKVYPTSLNQIKGSFKIPKSPYGSEYKIDTEKEEIVLIYFENNVKKILRKRYKPEKNIKSVILD